jgi:uncharacterized protein YjbI with pentapeptide repeats
MKDLHSILKAVAKGKLEVARAESLIQELFEASHGGQDALSVRTSKRSERRSEPASSGHGVSKARQTIDAALAHWGERVGIDALVKKSKSLGKKVEFRPEHAGFDAKLSLFTEVNVSADSEVELNVVSGSQWKNTSFLDQAEVRRNHFTLSQISGLKCGRSNFSSNELGLARLSEVTIAESRFENNRLSRSQCRDFSMTESDFTHNKLLRAEISGVVLNASRIANVVLNSSRWNECEFDQSDIQGIRFEGCSFEECRFVNCELVSTPSEVLEGLKAKGQSFEGLRSVAELRAMLEQGVVEGAIPQTGRASEGRPQRGRRSRPHREKR